MGQGEAFDTKYITPDTALVALPEGDLGDYLASLKRIAALEPQARRTRRERKSERKKVRCMSGEDFGWNTESRA